MLSKDSLFDGRLTCYQYQQGYRFSVDSVLLSQFLEISGEKSILDLGTGSGIISLILCYRFHKAVIVALEKQTDLFELAKKNIFANQLGERMKVLHGDFCRINEYAGAESFDYVFCNPPYTKPGSGRVNIHAQSARARHEIDCKLDDVVKAAFFAVKNKGSVALVYPARRAATLISSLVQHKLMPKRLQAIYSYPEDNQAQLVLVEAVKNGGEELQLMPPFFIYIKKNGSYSKEMQRCYA